MFDDVFPGHIAFGNSNKIRFKRLGKMKECRRSIIHAQNENPVSETHRAVLSGGEAGI